MKKVTSLLFVMVFSAFAFSISAQMNSQVESKSLKNKSGDNWFISLGAGANLLLGEQDKEQSMGDRLKFGGEFSIGKWFNSNFGMRAQFVGGSLKGFNFQDNRGGELKNRYTHANDNARTPFPRGYSYDSDEFGNVIGYNNGDFKLKDNGFWQEFEYGTLTIDLMANLTNLFRGYYKENNFLDLVPYVGVGYVRGFASESNPNFNGIVGKLGLRANFNISPKWAIYLEPQANIVSSEFDGYVGDADMDAITNLFLGVQYTFNRDFSTPDLLSLEEIDYLNRRINENRYLIDNHQDILERQQDLLERLEECCEEDNEVRIITNDKIFLPEYIRFGLDSYKIEGAEMKKISDAVVFLNNNPSAKLLLIGYADKLTGNKNYNMELSRKRAEAVSNELKRRNINGNRLVVKWMGDTEQPYDQNDLNRVVVMVER